MATKTTIEWTCDLCAAHTNHSADRQPLGWRRIQVTVGDAPEGGGMAPTEDRDICPFCIEALEACLAAHPAAAKAGGR